jgi:hypothetical protein
MTITASHAAPRTPRYERGAPHRRLAMTTNATRHAGTTAAAIHSTRRIVAGVNCELTGVRASRSSERGDSL